MVWLFLAAWAFSAVLLGYPLATLALRNESSRAVIACFGFLSGHVCQSILLVFLWSLFPLGTSFFIAIAVAVVTGAGLVFLLRRRPTSTIRHWGISAADTAGVSILLVTFVALIHRISVQVYETGNAELLYLHSALVQRMTFESFPPANPLDPDIQLRYRYTFHTLAAAIQSNANSLAPEVLPAVTAFLVSLIVPAMIGFSVRHLGNPRPGMIASIIGLLGGSLLPWYTYAIMATGADSSGLDHRHVVTGVIWGGNTLDMLNGNPTIAAGLAIAIVTLWFAAEVLKRQDRAPVALAIAALGMTYLGLMNEVYFALLACGILGWSAFSLSGLWQTTTGSRLSLGLGVFLLLSASLALIALRGGLAGGISIFGAGQGGVQLGLNLDHFGEVPGPPSVPWPYWVPLVTIDTAFDSNFALFGLPLLFALATKRRNSFVQIALLATLGGFLVWVTTYSQRRPADSFRIGQAALMLYTTVIPLSLGSLIQSQGASLRAARWVVPMLVFALVAPHAAKAAMTSLQASSGLAAPRTSFEMEPSAFLRESCRSARVLVPLESSGNGIGELYKYTGPGAAAASLLALSGCAIPMGNPIVFNGDTYSGHYERASRTLDLESMAALKIDWVYVLPSYLTGDQREGLRVGEDSGRLRFEKKFGVAGEASERWLFRFAGEPGGYPH